MPHIPLLVDLFFGEVFRVERERYVSGFRYGFRMKVLVRIDVELKGFFK